MAIALDTAGAIDTAAGANTTLTLPLTIGGSDRALVVGAWVLDGSDLLATLTCGGVNVPRIRSTIVGSDRWLYGGVLAAPATGAQNIILTISGGVGKLLALVAQTLTGCSGTPTDNSNIGTTNGVNSYTTSITPNVDNCWVVEVGAASATPTGASTGMTQRAITGDFGNGAGFERLILGDSNGAISPAASTSMTITAGNAGSDLGSFMVSIAPLESAALPFIMRLGAQRVR